VKSDTPPREMTPQAAMRREGRYLSLSGKDSSPIRSARGVRSLMRGEEQQLGKFVGQVVDRGKKNKGKLPYLKISESGACERENVGEISQKKDRFPKRIIHDKR